MLKWLARRLLKATILGFAALGFCYVPLAGRTAYERVRSLATSPATQQHLRDALDAARRLRDRLQSELEAKAQADPDERREDPER